MDFDWEYPCGDYKRLHTQFILQLRVVIYQFIPTTASGADKYTIDNCYEIEKLGQHLDLIHLMTYNYHGVLLILLSKVYLETIGSYWDNEAKVNYTYYNDQWTNAEDVRAAAAEKVLFIKANNYGVDDPTDVCHHGKNFPIHRTVARYF